MNSKAFRPENGEPDDSAPSGKASQRRRHLGGHWREEEESRAEGGRYVPGRGDKGQEAGEQDAAKDVETVGHGREKQPCVNSRTESAERLSLSTYLYVSIDRFR